MIEVLEQLPQSFDPPNPMPHLIYETPTGDQPRWRVSYFNPAFDSSLIRFEKSGRQGRKLLDQIAQWTGDGWCDRRWVPVTPRVPEAVLRRVVAVLELEGSSMSQVLEQLRKQLDQIVLDVEAQAQERERQLEEREQAVAAALELLSIDPAVARAYDQGHADAERRVQQLIELQLENLSQGSGARTVLRTLSRMVAEHD